MKWLPLVAALAAAPALAESPRLLVWINGDKAYNGLQKVGDAFEKASGVKVVVEHPVDATDKFQQAAGAGRARTCSAGRMTASASGPRPGC